MGCVLRPAEGDRGDRRACVPSPSHDVSEAPSGEFALQATLFQAAGWSHTLQLSARS